MDSRQARLIKKRYGAEFVIVIGDLDPEFGPERTVADPWGQPIDVFEKCFERLDRCANELCRILAERARVNV
jgi:hypothetical protein